jgi:hypothetical protein
MITRESEIMFKTVEASPGVKPPLLGLHKRVFGCRKLLATAAMNKGNPKICSLQKMMSNTLLGFPNSFR